MKAKALLEARIIEAELYLPDHREELKKAVYDDQKFLAAFEYASDSEMLHKLMIDKALERI